LQKKKKKYLDSTKIQGQFGENWVRRASWYVLFTSYQRD